MAETSTYEVTRGPVPLILVRGFGGLNVADEKRIAYQGFNDGTVYPGKRGENYIYEGLILRFIKSDWEYQDATNVVGYYGHVVKDPPRLEPGLADFDPSFFSGDKVVVDPAMALYLRRRPERATKTLWVFRYYDLDDREFATYGRALVRLIDFVRALARAQGDDPPPKVNIIAHSMGGLLVREAVQVTYPGQERRAADYINKIVTLGSPHRGITFQLLQDWLGIGAADELRHFNPEFQAQEQEPASYKNFERHFPLDRLLTVVGTNYRSYAALSSLANRLFSITGEFGPTYNRSDGLVKQISAQIPGAPRTFVHKCHGGPDSLVTSRESYEVATRFFFGNVKARLRLAAAEVRRGFDRFGRSELFLGVSVKPRNVDFELFHQSREAENNYGPFSEPDLNDENLAFPWGGEDRLIWEGWLDTNTTPEIDGTPASDLAIRLDIYLGERDSFGIGFSDNVIFHKQFFVHAQPQEGKALFETPPMLLVHDDPNLAWGGSSIAQQQHVEHANGGWEFVTQSDAFLARWRLELESVPKELPVNL